MKNLNPLLSLAILLLLVSCEKEQSLPAATTEIIKIVLDLEEQQFLFDDHWYPWEIPIVNCQPNYSLNLDWAEARLQLRQCDIYGELRTASLVLQHSTCADTQPLEVQITAEHTFRTYQIQLPPERLMCWQMDRQWLEFSFEIEL